MYFCFDGDGFTTFKSAIEAKRHAEESLADARASAGDGWDEESLNICWGKVLEHVVITNERQRTDDDCFIADGIDTIQERELLPTEA